MTYRWTRVSRDLMDLRNAFYYSDALTYDRSIVTRAVFYPGALPSTSPGLLDDNALKPQDFAQRLFNDCGARECCWYLPSYTISIVILQRTAHKQCLVLAVYGPVDVNTDTKVVVRDAEAHEECDTCTYITVGMNPDRSRYRRTDLWTFVFHNTATKDHGSLSMSSIQLCTYSKFQLHFYTCQVISSGENQTPHTSPPLPLFPKKKK